MVLPKSRQTLKAVPYIARVQYILKLYKVRRRDCAQNENAQSCCG
jgi:hypothetical protein